MLNNRLEDLIYKYQKYRFNLFIRYTLFLVLSLIMIGGVGFVYQKIVSVKDKKPPKKIEKKDMLLVEKKIEKPKIIQVVKPKPKPKVEHIDEEKAIDKNSYNTLMAIEKNKPTYQSAYDLSEYYFGKKDFQKASKWAMVATNRDEKQAKAWIIYAKSKIKLNQKGIAKKALKIYLLKYHSREVSNLLNSL